MRAVVGVPALELGVRPEELGAQIFGLQVAVDERAISAAMVKLEGGLLFYLGVLRNDGFGSLASEGSDQALE